MFRLTNKDGQQSYYNCWANAYVDWTSDNNLITWEELVNDKWVTKSNK